MNLRVLFLLLIASLSCAANVTVDGLKCEYRQNPLGIDTTEPRLSWVVESGVRNEKQTVFQILAASSPESLARNKGDLWDSGKVASAESIGVVYGGKALTSMERVWWKVRVWNGAGKVSPYSHPAWFETALMSADNWQARWIQRKVSAPSSEDPFNDHPAPLLRKEFVVHKNILRARAYVSGLGYYELHLNGHTVGDHVLDPGWTSYSRRVLYSTYDVTDLIRKGTNAAGIMLGNGWFKPLPLAFWGHLKIGDALTTGEPRAIVQVMIEYTDGTRQIVGSDESWRSSEGPILRNNVYLGEVYDARREQSGWDKTGFDDSRWETVALADKPRLGSLQAQDAPPIRITRRIRAVQLTEPKPGVFIFDFGQNFAGWATLKVHGHSGARVRLRSGELLYTNGLLDGMTAVAGQIKGGGPDYHYEGAGPPKTAFELDEYVLKGEGTETFTPHFTFHGFRYVEVTGYPGRPHLDSLEGLALNSDVATAGSFECSDELLNRIQAMVRRTELANLFSVQSDCPHREKFGYGGDLVASSEMAMLNFDMDRFYTKVTRDFVDAARPNGGFTETAPFVGISDQSLGETPSSIDLGPGVGPIDWGLAQPFLLWQLRQYYGDQRPLRDEYESTKRWVKLLESKAVDGLFDSGISDHETLAPKPRALTGTAAYYFNVKLFSQIAAALGHTSDAEEAAMRAEKIRDAFNRSFLHEDTGRYDTASQACQAFALYLGLTPPNEEKRALDVLVRDVLDLHRGHPTTGIFGTKYMLDTLSDHGRADVAYSMVHQRSFPGWGFMLENGATTLWEHWAWSDNVYSHDHPMFGSVSEWFYKGLAGINPAPDAVGCNRLIIRPQPVGDLQWVKASYDSVRGKIVSDWRRKDGRFSLSVRIPVGSSATVYLPARNPTEIKEGGRPIRDVPDIEFVKMESGNAILQIGSGEYDFASTLP